MMEFEAAVERQKLVSDQDEELNEIITTGSSTTVVQKTPISPNLSTDTSKNSFTKTNSETRISYHNERRYDFKQAKKRIQKDETESSSSSNLIDLKPAIVVEETSAKIEPVKEKTQSSPCSSSLNVNSNNHNVNPLKSSVSNLKTESLNKSSSKPNLHSFAARPLKHHSFVSEVPDVRHMEKALLKLLDDFHSGKLRAFGSGVSMNQMKNIREQQEKLAKLHFDLGSEMSFSEQTSQEKQKLVIEQLEQLSVLIEKLNSTNTDG